MRLASPKDGQTREKTFFAMFPISVAEHPREWRWLEKVTTKQKYHAPTPVSIGYWEDVQIIDSEYSV